MNKKDIEFLNVLGDVLHSNIKGSIDIEDFSSFFNEVYSQSIYGLYSSYVDDMGLSSNDYSMFSEYLGKQIRYYYTLMEDQDQVLQDLSSIPCVVLKGAAAGMNYPFPDQRNMGDIDLLVSPTDFEKAYHTLVSLGYSTSESLEQYERHITFKTTNRIEIELHDKFSSSNNSSQNKILDELLYSAIYRREMVSVSDYSIPVLPPLENGLVLLSHINEHVRSGLGLRQIIDWMYFTEKYMDTSFWNTFSIYAEKIGMKKLAMVTTCMCQRYLKSSVDLDFSEYEDLSEELMELILKHGNFGRKEFTKTSTVNVVHILRNPVKAVIKAQKIGCVTWEVLKKYPFLKPFAWIYQIGRWANHGIQKGVTPSSIKKAMDTEKEESDLLDRLEVTR